LPLLPTLSFSLSFSAIFSPRMTRLDSWLAWRYYAQTRINLDVAASGFSVLDPVGASKNRALICAKSPYSVAILSCAGLFEQFRSLPASSRWPSTRPTLWSAETCFTAFNQPWCFHGTPFSGRKAASTMQAWCSRRTPNVQGSGDRPSFDDVDDARAYPHTTSCPQSHDRKANPSCPYCHASGAWWNVPAWVATQIKRKCMRHTVKCLPGGCQ